MSNSTTTITSATAAFAYTDVGKTITGTDITAGTTIASVSSATTAVLSATATGSHASGSWTIGAASARSYLIPQTYAPGFFYIHDFSPATAPVVKVDTDNDGTFDTTWTAGTDYQLEPLVSYDVEAGPQNTVRLIGNQFLLGPWQGRANVQITAKWGWPAVPSPISKACALLAVDYYRAKDVPFGIGGGNEYGPFRIKENQIVMGLLGQYRLPRGVA